MVGLHWSPPGLSRHHRCSLAILTSNHVLSLWASTAYPHERVSWHRVLVVNHALSQHFGTQLLDKQHEGESRRRCRIRSFTWPHFGTADPGEAFYLAVSNDCDEILICQIASPYLPLTDADSWTASVKCLNSKPCKPIVIAQSERYLEDAIPPIRSIKAICWSPWRFDSNGHSSSIIACTSEHSSFLLWCQLEISGSRKELSVDNNRSLLDVKRCDQLAWVDTVCLRIICPVIGA